MIEEEKDEKYISIFKICLLVIAYIIVGVCGLFIILVSKVDALDYIKFYNNNGNIKECINENSCSTVSLSYNAYEFATPIQLTTNIDLTVNVIYKSIYEYQDSVVNESGLYVYLRGTNITPMTCTDNGTQSVGGGTRQTKTYRHNITCTLSVSGVDAYQLGVAMSVARTVNNGGYWWNSTVEVESISIMTAPNTSGIEGAIDSGNTNIINNNNQNTQNIMSNDNKNTQDIIDNQNANSQAQIDKIDESFNTCEFREITNFETVCNKCYLNANGEIKTTQNFSMNATIQYNISKGKTYTFTSNTNYENYYYYCIIDKNNNKVCNSMSNNFTVTPTEDSKIQLSIYIRSGTTNSFNGQYCYNRLDKENENLDHINDTLNDSSVDNPSSDLQGLESNFGTNSVISDLLLLPVTLYQSVLNSINGTCTPFNLGTLYNHQLRMPCINVTGVIGSAIYGVIDVLISGFFILSIRKKFVDIFESFTSLKVGGNELE